MTALPSFSGDLPTCTKCAATGATIQYRSYGQCTHGASTEEVTGTEPNDRLHRQCVRCGHQWDEAVVPPVPVVQINVLPDPPAIAEAIRDIRRFGPGRGR